VSSLAFTPDGRYLVSTGYDSLVRFWSTDGWMPERTIDLRATGTFSLALAPGGKQIAVGVDHRVLLYSLEQGIQLEELPVKPKGVYGLAFSPDGRWLALASADKRVRVWERGDTTGG
jgi:WD40 repeat protein